MYPVLKSSALDQSVFSHFFPKASLVVNILGCSARWSLLQLFNQTAVVLKKYANEWVWLCFSKLFIKYKNRGGSVLASKLYLLIPYVNNLEDP